MLINNGEETKKKKKKKNNEKCFREKALKGRGKVKRRRKRRIIILSRLPIVPLSSQRK